MTALTFSEALLILTAGGDYDDDAGDDAGNDDDDDYDDRDDGDDDDLPGPSIRLTPSAALMQKRFVTKSSGCSYLDNCHRHLWSYHVWSSGHLPLSIALTC